MKRTIILLAILLAFRTTAAWSGTVQIDTVLVDDAGNLPDPLTGYGAVSYPYQIGKYDVTEAQYMNFLTAVASTADPYGLYNPSMATATPTYGITQTSTSAGFVYALRSAGSANVPVTYVSWGDASRFVNWLANGEPNGPEGPGTTETGTYALNGSTGSAALIAVTRSSTATWVLSTIDEWYKSAYFIGGGTNAGYWQYPTRSNDEPSNILSSSGTNNANFYDFANSRYTDPSNLLTPVGAFAASPGPFGTYDQGGDVEQWIQTPASGMYYKDRGGSWGGISAGMGRDSDGAISPTASGPSIGFRVASVPEPCTGALLALSAFAYFYFRFFRGRLRE